MQIDNVLLEHSLTGIRIRKIDIAKSNAELEVFFSEQAST